MRDISLLTAVAAILLGSIGFAVPDSSRAKRYQAVLWGLAGAFLVFNLMLWRSTSLDAAQYGSCLIDAKPDACAPLRGSSPTPTPSTPERMAAPTGPFNPFPITQSWAGMAITDGKPPKALPGNLTVRIYRNGQSDELLLRFGECVQRLQLTSSDDFSRIYAANTDLNLSGGWGKYPWPCMHMDWVEKVLHNDNVVKLSYSKDRTNTLLLQWRGPDSTDGTPSDTVYNGTLVGD